MRNPNGPSIEEKEAMQDQLDDMNEAWIAARRRMQLKSYQIKHMVERFLQWRLPENFNPDGGISFKKTFNEKTTHPMKHEPVGTNLFDYGQAEAMIRYITEGMPD